MILTFLRDLSLPVLFLGLFLLIVNLITFFVFGFDKMASLNDRRRIRERTLFLLALFGGSLGALLGMNFFRHKTKKTSFQLVFVCILLVQIGIIAWLFSRQIA